MSHYPNNPEQATWLAKARQGDDRAFSKIVEAYQKSVYNLCRYMLNEATEAEDATQEIFIRAYFKLDSYDPKRKFSTWLFSIASHYCLDMLKKRRFRLVSWDSLPAWYRCPTAEPLLPESVLIETETLQEVRHLLDALSPDYRTVVILKYWNTMSYEEIAQTLNTSSSAIKSRLFRARRMMARATMQPQRPNIIPGKVTALAV